MALRLAHCLGLFHGFDGSLMGTELLHCAHQAPGRPDLRLLTGAHAGGNGLECLAVRIFGGQGQECPLAKTLGNRLGKSLQFRLYHFVGKREFECCGKVIAVDRVTHAFKRLAGIRRQRGMSIETLRRTATSSA